MRTRWLPPFSTIFAVLYSYTAKEHCVSASEHIQPIHRLYSIQRCSLYTIQRYTLPLWAALALALRKLPVLKRLDLSACKFGDEDVASLLDNLAKDDFKALEILVIVANNVTEVGCAKLVAAIKGGRMPKLRDVAVLRNSASNAAAKSIIDAIQDRANWVREGVRKPKYACMHAELAVEASPTKS